MTEVEVEVEVEVLAAVEVVAVGDPEVRLPVALTTE